MATEGFRIEGDEELRRKLRQMGDEVGKVGGGILLAEAHKIMTRSEPQVPFRDGILRGSATVGQPQISGPNASIKFGYGGAAKAYAAVQHERLDFAHKVGKAKYLEDPVIEHLAVFPRNVGTAFQQWLKRFKA
jgi:hypothetical protein